MHALKLVNNSKYWLLSIAACLITIHFYLSSKADDLEAVSLSIIFWGAIISLVWEKKDDLNLESGVFSSLLGTVILVLALFKTTQLSSSGLFLQLFPLIAALGLGLIASGFQGLKQYWQEFILLLILALPGETALSYFFEQLTTLTISENLTTLTAKFATFTLKVLGFQVSLDQTNIILPNTVVNVYEGCSGARGMDFLLRLSILVLVMFPTDKLRKILAPVAAILVALIVNGFRVTLMSYLANTGNNQAFNYWHLGNGSQIFGVIAVVIYGFICFLMLRQNKSEEFSGK